MDSKITRVLNKINNISTKLLIMVGNAFKYGLDHNTDEIRLQPDNVESKAQSKIRDWEHSSIPNSLTQQRKQINFLEW
jgi:hypothetical protein